MIGENSHYESLPRVLIGPQQDYTVQNFLLYSTWHVLSQHRRHVHPSKRVARDHQGRKTANIGKWLKSA